MQEKDKFKKTTRKKSNMLLKTMKIYLLISFSCAFSLIAENTYSQLKSVTLKITNVTLNDALKQIEESTDYLFLIMDDSGNDLEKKVSINFDNKSIDEILTQLLKDTNLSYSVVKKQITIRKNLKNTDSSTNSEALQQPSKKPITGKVSGVNGESIIGANIIEKGTTNGTVTDFGGNFTLNVGGNAILRITYIGYLEQEINTKNRNTINIILQEDTQALDEVVVVGYGVQKKETVTGAISTVREKEILQNPVASLSNALVGRVPGISSVQASGEPGYNTSTIRIRGLSTLNSAGQEPLIVIDGVQSSMREMNTIDPNEIQAVSVLKDASATAVYGIRGANGVVIVTTKRGASGKPKINFSYNYGITQLATKIKMLDSYSYAVMRNDAIINDNIAGNFERIYTEDQLWKFKHNRDFTPEEVAAMDITDSQKQKLLNMPSFYYQSHDYFDENFGNTAPQENININMSGGTSVAKYFASIGYFNQKGVLKDEEYDGYNINPNYDRYNFRSNIDIDAIKNLKISVDMSGQFEERKNMIGSSGDFMDIGNRNKQYLGEFFASQPFAGPGFVDNKLILGYTATPQYPSQKNAGSGDSPIQRTFNNPMLYSNSSTFNLTLRLKHDMSYLLKGLSLSGTITNNDLYTKARRFQKSVAKYRIMRNPNDPTDLFFFEEPISQPIRIEDNYAAGNYKMKRIYIEGKIDYMKTFENHSFTGLLLYNINRASNPDLAFRVPNTVIGSAARLTYDYAQRYLLEFNGAYNGSENFPPGLRFGFFPAFSTGWVLSNEPFFSQNNLISWFKLRASYGEVGNDFIRNDLRFLYLPDPWGDRADGYHFGTSNNNTPGTFYPGATQTGAGNPRVTWERAKKYNVGLDVNFFKNKLTIVGDLFKEHRKDILWIPQTIPGIVSPVLPPANIGEMSNQGYELELGWSDVINGSFSYGIKGHVNYARNKITYMDEPNYEYEWMNTTNFMYGQYKGFKSQGFYNTPEQTFNRPYASTDGNKVQPGDIRYIDIDGDGKIDNNDRIPIGNSNLPRYYFGSTIDLAYKGFDLSVLFTGSMKGSLSIWSSSASYILNPFYQGVANAFQYQFDGRWTPEKLEQQITPTFPRASTVNQQNQNGANSSDFWIMPSDFIKLKNIQLSYTITNLRKLKEVGLSSIRLYVSGNNLYTWKSSKLIDGYDPEQADASGVSAGYLYPPTKVYNVGVNITF